MQTITEEQSIPDLVQTAWTTEERIKSLEIATAPTMTDLRDTRIKVEQIATELHETKVHVLSIARQQNGMIMEIGKQGIALGHMQAELHGVMNDQRQMKAEMRKHSVILNLLADHFGLVVPEPEG